MAHIILVPGLWLDGSSWRDVVPTLEEAGHRTHALTLPGMESASADRSRVTLRDHVDGVVVAIDAVEPEDGLVVLVGHSAGSGVAHAAVDARPYRVARAIYVGGFPRGDGETIGDGFPAENGDVVTDEHAPAWWTLAEAEVNEVDVATWMGRD